MKIRLACTVVALMLGAMGASAQEAPLLGASEAFLASLGSTERAMTLLPFNSEERLNWHFIPKKRLGLPFKVMSSQQKDLALATIRAGLSETGFSKAETIRSLEIVLHEMEGAAIRDSEMYHMLFFGEPSAEGNWAFRYEGHHVSLSWTFLSGKLVSSSPQFFGANPAVVRLDGPMKGTRALGKEEDAGRRLLEALSETQRKIAVISLDVPRDIFTAASQRAERLPDTGIAYGDLDANQQGLLIGIIEEVARAQAPSIARRRLNDLREAGLAEVKFAWIGSGERGAAHYYRVQGSTFVIEYDNVQNQANHIHVVWRDFDGDFGRDVLRAHYVGAFDPARPFGHAH